MYYPHINLLRAFAAVSVLIYHAIEHFSWKTFPAEGFMKWFHFGWMGVDLFFVISGFVVTLSTLSLYDKTQGQCFKREFTKRRLVRIAPLYYITLFFFIVFIQPTLMVHGEFLKHLFTHLTFTHNFFKETQGSMNGPNWSVAAEMQFYLLIMFLIPYVKRYSPIVILSICVLTSWVLRFIVFRLFQEAGPDGNVDVFGMFIYSTQTLSLLDEFAFGIFLALILYNIRKPQENSILTKFYNLPTWVWALLAVTITTVTLKVYLNNSMYWDNASMVIFWRTLAGLACFFIVGLFTKIKLPTILTILLKPIDYLGKISYGLYLWHLLVLLSIKELHLDPLQSTVYTLIITILLSSLSWHFFEKLVLDTYNTKKPSV